ncbi:hypothetical protein L2725_10770 [Shewanella corallii]|uniref:Uncharacterized protein n=2 Tax=Shewanella TaxID=22 RepID=A0ABT0N7A0_9GAMM|nr:MULTISPECIES: hypothetical protein [Shewanella]MCL1037611.1 hypothetical protein [Shewanella submarina]MCL2914250.1 hypothetical protein [Shewanella corallii]
MDFTQINKDSARSFNEQKNLIKRMGKGQRVSCPECGQSLQLRVPGKQQAAEENKSGEQKYGIYCPKKCTDIELEFEA